MEEEKKNRVREEKTLFSQFIYIYRERHMCVHRSMYKIPDIDWMVNGFFPIRVLIYYRRQYFSLMIRISIPHELPQYF